MSARALVAPLARKRKHLEQKGATRPHKAIAGRLPAGSAELHSVPKGKDYVVPSKSKAGQGDGAASTGSEGSAPSSGIPIIRR